MSWPGKRVRRILGACDAKIILDQEALGKHLKGDARRAPEPARLSPSDLAYVIGTSGSRGYPKPVAVEHRGLVPMLEAQVAAFDLRPGDRVLWMLSPSFDASVSDIGTALLAGAALHVFPDLGRFDLDRLVRALSEWRITHIDLPPSLLPLIDPEDLPASLRTVVVGGEAADPATVRRWASRVRLVNVYGPTEATVCTSLGACHPETWREPLLGQPLPGARYHLIDGELCIEGDCLARGYVGQPELTAVKFPVVDGVRVFRTGDRVRLREDGEFVYLGRVDRQIKLHGRLIAPEEVRDVPERAPRRAALGGAQERPRRRRGAGRVRRAGVAGTRRAVRLAPRPAAVVDGPGANPPARRAAPDAQREDRPGGG